MTGGSVIANGTNSVGMRISGGGPNTNRLTMQNTSLSSTSDSFRVEGGSIANIALRNMVIHNNNGNLLSANGTVEFVTSGVNMSGRIQTLGGSNYVDLGNSTVWGVTANSNMTGLENTSSTILFAPPSGDRTLLSSYKTITVGSDGYNSNAGNLIINTYLATDGSPSDRLIIDGAGSRATGITRLTVRNTGGTGAPTVSDGILVVDAQNGGTTQANAFQLANRIRAGAYDYFLFRSGLDGVTNPDDWFLRSTFISNPGGVPITTLPAPPPPLALFPVVPLIPIIPAPTPSPTPSPAPSPTPSPGISVTLPPGFYPITGPELPAYGVAHPIALTSGLTVLGTMHERIGDTLTRANLGDRLEAQSWGRVFGQNIERRYAAYTNPTANGNLVGFQAGQDIFRREGITGDRDRAGLYLAYARSNLGMDGLVTNASATGYVRTGVGDMFLNGYSLAGYWTHYGANEWYVNAVIQGTHYRGETETLYTSLPLNGQGVLGSLEAGYPVKIPLGHHFVLEPQAQGIWQQVDFKAQHDGYGRVDPGRASMTTGRLGLRGQWTLLTENGVVWQPYLRVNYWRDWGDNAITQFDNTGVPLVIWGQRMEYAGGLSIKTDDKLSFYAQGGIQHGIGEESYEKLCALTGNVGLRYIW